MSKDLLWDSIKEMVIAWIRIIVVEEVRWDGFTVYFGESFDRSY